MDYYESTVEFVRGEVKRAYIDCWGYDSEEDIIARRDLHFKASSPVKRDDAVKIMKEALPYGYNVFEADLLYKLPEDCKVTLARESSVCIYVDKLDPEAAHAMQADECSKEGDQYRLWWD